MQPVIRDKCRTLQHWLILLVLGISCTAVRAADKPAPLVMGVLPFVSPITLHKRFAPLRTYLSDKLGRDITFVTEANFARFKNATERGEYDIVITAPHFVPDALDSGYYNLQATPTNSLSAHLVVREDSGINSIEGLRDPVIATPPDEAIITIIGKKQFANMGLRPARYDSYNNHNAAYQAMLRHHADAAIISINVLSKALDENKPLRVIAVSKEFPGVGVLTAKRLPDAMQQTIQTSFITLQDTAQGREVLEQIAYPGYRAAQPELYQPFRELLHP